jgi:acyl carrier protein
MKKEEIWRLISESLEFLPDDFYEEDNLLKCPTWDSLGILSIIGNFKDKFNVTLEGKKLNSLKAIEACKKLKKGVSFLPHEKRVEIGKSLVRNKKGIHSLSEERRSEISKKNYNEGKGFASLTKEQRREIGIRNWKDGKGMFSLTKEQRSEISKKIFIEKKGVHSLTKEETIKNAIKGGKKAKELGVEIGRAHV